MPSDVRRDEPGPGSEGRCLAALRATTAIGWSAQHLLQRRSVNFARSSIGTIRAREQCPVYGFRKPYRECTVVAIGSIALYAAEVPLLVNQPAHHQAYVALELGQVCLKVIDGILPLRTVDERVIFDGTRDLGSPRSELCGHAWRRERARDECVGNVFLPAVDGTAQQPKERIAVDLSNAVATIRSKATQDDNGIEVTSVATAPVRDDIPVRNDVVAVRHVV